MKKLLILIAATLTSNAFAKPITIAVIDTGISKGTPHLCKFGHKSFVSTSALEDTHGHGNLMAKRMNEAINKKSGYCLVSIKWYQAGLSDEQHAINIAAAINYAVNINVKFINMSGGGGTAWITERAAVARALKKKITFVAAAGNEGKNLDEVCNFFPACYDNRVITVGNKLKEATRVPSSNYGNYVKRWEVGTPSGGTSTAAAITTGKLVRAKLVK